MLAPEDEILRMQCVSLYEHTVPVSYRSRNITRRIEMEEGSGREWKRCTTPAGNRVWDARELPWTVLCIPNAYRAISMHRMHGQLIYSRNKPPSFSINRKALRGSKIRQPQRLPVFHAALLIEKLMAVENVLATMEFASLNS